MTDMADRGTPLVLVADDEEDIRALVAFRLQRAGYDVITAADGEEALRLATTRLPDLIVLDMMMPKATGLEVTRSLRAQDATKDIPVIILTARAQEADVASGFEAGADDYVKKPFSPKDLQLRVQALLEGSTAASTTASTL
jgi:DNA-binding response OmpR family regulator